MLYAGECVYVVTLQFGLTSSVGGGSKISRQMESVERMNPGTGEWTCVAPMSRKLGGVGVDALNNMLYVVGGFDGQSDINSMERFKKIS